MTQCQQYFFHDSIKFGTPIALLGAYSESSTNNIHNWNNNKKTKYNNGKDYWY